MGYRLRTSTWAYTAWFEFDWGRNGDPAGAASLPKWDAVVARELYTHVGDSGDEADGESFEWRNVAEEAANHDAIYAPKTGLHDRLVAAIKTGIVKPLLN
jgi:hypothetical protein